MTATPDPTTPAPRPIPELDLDPAPGPADGPSGEHVATDGPSEEESGPDADAQRRRRQVRRTGAVAGVAAAVVLVVVLLTSLLTSSASATHAPSRPVASTSGNRSQAALHRSVDLAAATTAPAPAPPSLANAAPLQSHEVFGYAPYWTLPQSSQFDVNDLTTLAYFSVDANADGTLDQSGAGWNGYESQDLVNLVTRAHAAGDRVVLTVTCFSQQSLDAITSDPNAPGRLSAALIAAVQGKNLDGVNFDFEGEGSADQVGLTNLITKVSAALHTANPHWQVTMAVYASSAGDPHGFYNIAAVAPALDGFFVMAYDMNSKSQPSATSPLFGGNYSDVQAIESFLKVVPPSKIVLGLPYYGYDWPTTGGTLPATATGSESPLPYSSIKASGHPTYWDPVTDTPWTSYQVGTQWHTTFFDDPTSMALKAQLANFFHIAGVGIWALGMDGNDPAMLAALLGNAPAAKDAPVGPPPGTGFVSTASYTGIPNLALTPIDPPPPGGSSQLVGHLDSFTTNDPALACLQADPTISVWSYSAMPGLYVAVATAPGDCTTAMFSFPVPPPSATTTTTSPGGTTTTTRPPSTTTTTTHPSTTTTTTSTTTTTTSSTTTTTTTTVP
jgi:hypothetical protein